MVDKNRLVSSIRQAARKAEVVRQPDEVVELTERLSEYCGDSSQSRQMLYRIALLLLQSEALRVIVPVCPDYTQRDGQYTFEGLGSGIPHLAKLHRAFLGTLRDKLPLPVEAVFLIADLEAEDPVLCRSVGIDRDEFARRVQASCFELSRELAQEGWEGHLMTSWMPDLEERERHFTDIMSCDASLRARLNTETQQRMDMYCRISSSLTVEDMQQRTLRTAAQYRAVGECAVQRGFGLCNHTTVNLSWYSEMGAAVIHNPVSIY